MTGTKTSPTPSPTDLLSHNLPLLSLKVREKIQWYTESTNCSSDFNGKVLDDFTVPFSKLIKQLNRNTIKE